MSDAKGLVFTVAVFVLGPSTVITCSDPAAAQVSPASPLPSASPASVLDHTIDMDGVLVPLHDFATLITAMLFVYVPAKGPHATAVMVTKKQGEMPAFDPDFHYAGTDGAPDQPQLTMWISDRLGGKAPRAVMESAAILGLLDSGLADRNFSRYTLRRAKTTSRSDRRKPTRGRTDARSPCASRRWSI